MTRVDRALKASVLTVLVGFSAALGTKAETPSGKVLRSDLVGEIHPVKPVAPVDVSLTVVGDAVQGRAVDVAVTVTPRVATRGIELRILPSTALRLTGPDVQVLGGAAAGETVTSTFSVIPNSGGVLRVGVLVTLDADDRRQSRPGLLTLGVKGAVSARSSKPDTRLETTPTGDRVVVFQGH